MSTNFNPVPTPVVITLIVSDLLQRAYRMARALKHPQQGISNSESQEGLQVLNEMIDGFKAEALMIEYTRQTKQPVLTGQSSYSVGPGQDWDIERPEKIHRASFIIVSGTISEGNVSEIPLEMILTYERWQAIINKTVTSEIPLAFYYQPAPAIGIANLWPVPNIDTSIFIYTPQYLSEFNTVDDSVLIMDGWRQMLTYNLAVAVHELYPDRQMAPSVSVKASWYKQQLKANLLTPLFITSDPAAMQEQRSRGWYGGNPRAWTPY